MDDLNELRKAGMELAEYADLISDVDARSRSEVLFPFIYLASKKMSSRAISRWFSEKKDVDFSAASVAKILRESDKYFRLIAERVQTCAEHVCSQHGQDMEELLFQPYGTEAFELKIEREFPGTDVHSYTKRVLSDLQREWFDLDHEIQFRCRPFFQFEAETKHTNEEYPSGSQ